MKTTFLLSAILLCIVMFSYGQWDSTYLSQPRAQMGTVSLGSKAYFAGGYNNDGIIQTQVEIYDVKSHEWSYGDLSVARCFPACVASGSKVFFAGGSITMNPPFTFFSTVDIFDTLTQQWTVEQLSAARFDISAVSKGTKVLFAGGVNVALDKAYDVVDIYDTQTHEWTINHLSVPRGSMGASVVGDSAIFAGGSDIHSTSDQVDIYHFSTGTWSTAKLSQARGFVSATTIGNKVLFAGGFTTGFISSSRVDIYDASTGVWSKHELSVARCSQKLAVTAGSKAFIVGGFDFDGMSPNNPTNIIDVYDSKTKNWTTINMAYKPVWHTAVAVEDYLLIAGGQVELSGDWPTTARLFIYNDLSTGIIPFPGYDTSLKVFPNPASNIITIEYQGTGKKTDGAVTIYGNVGQQVMYHQTNGLKSEIDISNLPFGIYFIKLIRNNKITTGKFVKN